MLVDKYQNMVINMSYTLTGSHADADEVAQDVFLRVFHHIDSFKGDSLFKTWLISITKNLCYTKIMKHKKEKEKLEAYYQDIELNKSDELVRNQATPVSDALSKLPLKYKEVITLRHISGLKIREVANLLHLSESAIKMRYTRALEMLKSEFENQSNAPLAE